MARRNGILNALRHVVAAAGPRRAARGHHRAVHRHALGHHLGLVQQWLGGDDVAERPAPASPPPRAWPRARPASSCPPTASPTCSDGEILVAPLTAPWWAPVFGKIAATVTDVGGIMSHAAIVCREYGLPAVTGTAFGTKNIKTGQRVRVDGNAGTVTVID